MYNEASIISHSGDTTKAILKRTYPLFYWFAYFLDDSWYNFTMEKLRRIRDDKMMLIMILQGNCNDIIDI